MILSLDIVDIVCIRMMFAECFFLTLNLKSCEARFEESEAKILFNIRKMVYNDDMSHYSNMFRSYHDIRRSACALVLLPGLCEFSLRMIT